MSAQKFFNISAYKTASRCWIPVNQQMMVNNTNRFFSSKQRCINFNNITDSHLVSNDSVLSSNIETSKPTSNAGNDEYFEPTIFSSEEIHTAGPVNKA